MNSVQFDMKPPFQPAIIGWIAIACLGLPLTGAAQQSPVVQDSQPGNAAANRSAEPSAAVLSPPNAPAVEADRGTPPPAAVTNAAGQSPPAPAAVQAAPKLPSADEIQKQIEVFSSDESLDADLKNKLIEALKVAAERQSQAATTEQQRAQLEQSTAQAPQQLQSLVKTLSEKPGSGPSLDIGASGRLEDVKAEKQQKESELEVTQKQLEDLKTEILRRQAEEKLLPQRLVELQNRVKQLENTPVAVTDEMDPRLAEAKRMARESEIAQAKSELALASQQAKSYEAEEELLNKQVDLLTRRVAMQRAALNELSALLANQRQLKLQQTTRAYQQIYQQASKTYQAEAAKTLQLMESWPEVVTGIVTGEAKELAVKAEASQLKADLEQKEKIVETDLERDGSLSRPVGVMLQRKRERLPSTDALIREQRELAEQIDAAQSLEADIESRLDELPETAAAAELAGSGPGGDDLAARLKERELLEQMKRDVGNYISDVLIEISVVQDDYITTIESYKNLVDTHLLWIRDSAPFKLSDFKAAWYGFRWMVHFEHLKSLGAHFLMECRERPILILIWVFGTASLLAFGSRIRRRVRELGRTATQRSMTDMRPTLAAILHTLVLSLAPAVALGIPGFMLSSDQVANDYLLSVGRALLVAAALVMPLELLRQTVRIEGLAVAHFGWPAIAADPLRRNLRWMIDLGIPLVVFWQVAAGQDDNRAILGPFARLLFVSVMILVSIVLWRVSHPRNGAARALLAKRPDGWLDRLRMIWHPLITAIPLFLAALSLYGYTYSTALVAGYLYKTLWVLTAALLAGGLIMRWLVLNRRRMAMALSKQRLEQRQNAPESGVGEVPNTSEVDLAAVNEQTLRLVNAMLIASVLLGLFVVWRPVVPALSFFDDWEVWSVTNEDGTVEPVTLTNLMLTIPILILTVISVRNVPGLLESTVLQRLPIQNAARYAITTLGSYTLAGIGIVAAAQTLEIHWSNIQWLVAALGVGLGFGLQEIFANFVSGIILLFEQPLRVGDVVTIDSTTGIVSRIRMRATTVTNWDRQELIIPNKDLITGRLINWTLSDGTNRIVVNVGIAYGSNVPQAIETLKEVCAGHSNILEDPPPVVTFEGFGDSTLNLVVRAYLSSLESRLQTISELHMQINDQFNDRGIEISFPQRDLHLRSVSPEFGRMLGGRSDREERELV